jgi:beta-glucosidase
MKGIISMLCTTALLAGCQFAPDVELQIDELYDRMSQEERIAQLRSTYMDDLFDEQGKLDTAKCRQLIPNGIGHFSQYASQKPMEPEVLRDRVAAVQDWLMNNTPNGIPALFHEEVLSGINTRGATIYPQQIGQACSFNPELAELKTRQTSTARRKMGGVLSLSPMVDVCRTPSFNRLEESYGEDAYLSAVMGTAFVRGLQQDNLREGVGACSKHYLGYGGGGDADEKELMEEILLPHETMIRLAGSKAVMPGYHAVHGINCAANGEILNEILRDYLCFDGMVVSDYPAIDQLPDQADAVHKAAGPSMAVAMWISLEVQTSTTCRKPSIRDLSSPKCWSAPLRMCCAISIVPVCSTRFLIFMTRGRLSWIRQRNERRPIR